MTSARPYRERRTAEEAIAKLGRCSGTQFDPDVVRAFVEELDHQLEQNRAGADR
jgi:HD-GYP domain-containing protein (c-di-GMP phosphodiesterase class II)